MVPAGTSSFIFTREDTLNTTKQLKPTGTFKTWCAVKCDHEAGEVVLLDAQTSRRFTVEKDPNFECLKDGAVRFVVYERTDTPDGQVTRLLEIQSRTDDITVFTPITEEKVEA